MDDRSSTETDAIGVWKESNFRFISFLLQGSETFTMVKKTEWHKGCDWSVGDTWGNPWQTEVDMTKSLCCMRSRTQIQPNWWTNWCFVHIWASEKVCVYHPSCCCFHAPTLALPARLVWWGRWAACKRCQRAGLIEQIPWLGCAVKRRWVRRYSCD